MAKITVYLRKPSGHDFDLPNGKVLQLKGEFQSTSQLPGHGVTFDVESEDFEHVKKTHAEHPLFVNGHVFAADTKSAAAQAKEKAGEKTGFEPLAPEDKV